ncbi:hypothetical protein LXA43DRAFT_1104275 [Ganoderma leucocontextum]|nr:hypothetical protein LXA43DRAFT_1104275 [Ganoderma leucocontextum]
MRDNPGDSKAATYPSPRGCHICRPNMLEPLTPLACELDLPLPTSTWLQYQRPSAQQDIQVGTAVCVFVPNGTTKGPSGLIKGIIRICPHWVAFMGLDDEARTTFLLLTPREWTTLPPLSWGILPKYRSSPDCDVADDFPVPTTSLDIVRWSIAREWRKRTREAKGEARRWMGLGGVRVCVETKIVEVAAVATTGEDTETLEP